MSVAPAVNPKMSGKILAVQRLRRYGLEVDEAELMQSEAVDRAVDAAIAMLEEDPPPGSDVPVEAVMGYIEFTAEAAAFGAMTRVISGEDEMKREQIRGINGILKTIFNGLIVRR